MKALFDIGNTRIKWAWVDTSSGANSSLYDVGEASHINTTIDEIARANWTDWPTPEQIVVSSVVAETHWQQLSDWCVQHWQLKPVRVNSTTQQCGVSNAYTKPDELGSDRWAAMIGAHHWQHADTCIIDCGTAITIDFLDASGQHHGGYIIPGLVLMQQSLAQGTDAIQLSSQSIGLDIKKGANLGKSTAECIEYGAVMAVVSLIETACEKMKVSTGRRFDCLLTGGNASVLATCFDEKVTHEPQLVLLGLAHIATEINESRSMKL